MRPSSLFLLTAAVGVGLWMFVGQRPSKSVDEQPVGRDAEVTSNRPTSSTATRAEVPAAEESVDAGSAFVALGDAGLVPADFIPRDPGTPEALVGLEIGSLDDAERERLKVPEIYKGGVKVTRVDPRSAAAEASVKVGDVIVQALKTRVTTPGELRGVVSDREHTMIVVVRDGHAFNVTLHKPWRNKPVPSR
ncbi:MAG: PDZ domain-containing protein [Deltaproteobacteria bacterium]|nr:PDZ domain-containing protein [Deltaproteobacteria bacterium]